jgi:hypothetical protein
VSGIANLLVVVVARADALVYMAHASGCFDAEAVGGLLNTKTANLMPTKRCSKPASRATSPLRLAI